jgi:hypothetical protein
MDLTDYSSCWNRDLPGDLFPRRGADIEKARTGPPIKVGNNTSDLYLE